MTEKLLRLPGVLAMVGVSRSTLYEMVGSGSFPPPLKITKRAVGWPESTVANWIRQLRLHGAKKALDPR